MTGRYGVYIMRTLRVAGVVTLLGIGTFIVVMVRRERSQQPAAHEPSALGPYLCGPEQHSFQKSASTWAAPVDALYFFLIGLTAFFTLLIFALFIIFMVKYRRKEPNEIGARIHGGMALEIIWSVVPLFIVMGLFVWSAQLFFAFRPPAERHDEHLRCRQAVDVEVPAHGRPARNQRAARPGRSQGEDRS